MAKQLKDILESFDFNRAAIAKQRLQNIRNAKGRVRGARVANLMRMAGLKEEELDDEDFEQLDEVLSADASAQDWIHDFVHSSDPKFSGKGKKERIKMALGAYYHNVRHKDGEGLSEQSTPIKAIQLVMKEAYGVDISDEIADQILEAAKKYAGPVKVKVQADKEAHEETWETAKKKPVKEQYDEEGNLVNVPKTYQEFMEAMIATKVAPNVTRYTGGSYGNAKGAKYGNTDYDKETLETKDDEGSEEQKRGRGRPAGSKSGARGPIIK